MRLPIPSGSVVRVYNITREVLLATEVLCATSFLARAQGLLGRSELVSGSGLLISPCNWVHTWGMRITIDVAYVSRAGRVMACLHRMRPGRLGPLVRSAAWVLELPAGLLEATGTQQDDLLELGETGSEDRITLLS